MRQGLLKLWDISAKIQRNSVFAHIVVVALRTCDWIFDAFANGVFEPPSYISRGCTGGMSLTLAWTGAGWRNREPGSVLSFRHGLSYAWPSLVSIDCKFLTETKYLHAVICHVLGYARRRHAVSGTSELEIPVRILRRTPNASLFAR